MTKVSVKNTHAVFKENRILKQAVLLYKGLVNKHKYLIWYAVWALYSIFCQEVVPVTPALQGG